MEAADSNRVELRHVQLAALECCGKGLKPFARRRGEVGLDVEDDQDDADEDDGPSVLRLTDGEDAIVFQSYAGYVEGLVPFITRHAAVARGEDPEDYLADDEEDAD